MISRTDASIYRGPAFVAYDSQTYYFKGGLKAEPKQEIFTIQSDARGVIDRRLKQTLWEVTGVPTGVLSAGILTSLLPHTQCNPGASAMPATDKSLVIWPLNSKEKLTLNNAFVYKQPALSLGSTKTALGAITWYAIGTNNEAWSATNHIYTLADATFADTSLALAGLLTVPYTAALGALGAPWNAIQTKDGWEIDWNIPLTADEVDDIGVFDYYYGEDSGFTVKCEPRGIKVADLLALMSIQGTGVSRGMSVNANKANLVISGGTGAIVATLNGCVLAGAPHVYDVGHRIQSLEFHSVRSLTAGALGALYSLSIGGA